MKRLLILVLGKDERVRIDSFYDSVQFLYVLVKRLAS
jgi:acetylornithine deacetylase/succinyl-diaminopimelate desuccinylase-like protein